jgi:hypothetical protein
VVEATLDPNFAEQLLTLSNVGSVEVVENRIDGDTGHLAVRLSYEGEVDGIAARLLGSATPTWLQTYAFDLSTCEGSLTIVPGVQANLMDCRADITITDTHEGCRRVVDGELKIGVPLVGGKAERALTPAILERIDGEAELLRRWLSR